MPKPKGNGHRPKAKLFKGGGSKETPGATVREMVRIMYERNS